MDATDFNSDELRREIVARSPVSFEDYNPGR